MPAGTSRVEFRYELRKFTVGVVIALVGLAAFVLVALGVTRRARRRRSVLPGLNPNGGTPVETSTTG